MPEGRGIFPTLSVRENLIMAARPGSGGDTAGRREWTYEHVLATFPRLAERLGYGGGQLSGGEQQMLTIGRYSPIWNCSSSTKRRKASRR